LAYYYTLYFELFVKKITQYKVKPEDTYNMDEKGFLLGQLLKIKKVFNKAAFKSSKIKHIIQDSNKKWITLIATICVDKTHFLLGLIYYIKKIFAG